MLRFSGANALCRVGGPAARQDGLGTRIWRITCRKRARSVARMVFLKSSWGRRMKFSTWSPRTDRAALKTTQRAWCRERKRTSFLAAPAARLVILRIHRKKPRAATVSLSVRTPPSFLLSLCVAPVCFVLFASHTHPHTLSLSLSFSACLLVSPSVCVSPSP